MLHNLRSLRLGRKWRMEDAANAFGLSPKGYEKLEYNERGLTLDRIVQASKIYEVPIDEVLAIGSPVLVVGTIRHGGVVNYNDASAKPEVAPRPLGQLAHVVALRVDKGVTLPGLALEDFIIYHGEKKQFVPEKYISKLCVAKIVDGDVVIRSIYAGSTGDVFDLVGVGFETIRNARIEWCALVEWIKPS